MVYSTVRERTEHVISHALAANQAFLEEEKRAKFERMLQASSSTGANGCEAEVRLEMEEDKAEEIHALENAIRLMLRKQDDTTEQQEENNRLLDALQAKTTKLRGIARRLEEEYKQASAAAKEAEDAEQAPELTAKAVELAKTISNNATELEKARARMKVLLHDANARVLLEGEASPSCEEEEKAASGGPGRALPAQFR